MLPMADRPAIVLAAPYLEYQDLPVTTLLDHLRRHPGIGDGRIAGDYGAIVDQQEDVADLHRRTRREREFFDLDDVAGRNAVLLSAGFDDRVNAHYSKKLKWSR
ncbi:MAG: hypothetical protein A2V92_02710 [Candidatus Muproteobacteria bacterium RBG_16_65_31]|uniref:Uncharacterized protein n=1 Tax=Candidatus Muproteobacteria bacterium RBG_16_65_31 TaxID=1817759 RepID=A0A1F6TJG7_9PROT|nr:MAG: hypothetical protein A2V92_02710 [Candidatus Muproteobacteria bacterium RBG_16_65_31]